MSRILKPHGKPRKPQEVPGCPRKPEGNERLPGGPRRPQETEALSGPKYPKKAPRGPTRPQEARRRRPPDAEFYKISDL